jgi:hypothetical protein
VRNLGVHVIDPAEDVESERGRDTRRGDLLPWTIEIDQTVGN